MYPPQNQQSPEKQPPQKGSNLPTTMFQELFSFRQCTCTKRINIIQHWYIYIYYQYLPYHTLSPTETPCPWVSIHPRKWTWNLYKKRHNFINLHFWGFQAINFATSNSACETSNSAGGQILFLCGLCHDDSSTLGCLDPWDLSGFSNFENEFGRVPGVWIWARGVECFRKMKEFLL